MEDNRKHITVLGSTGSIGTQTLESAELLGIRVTAITANRSVKLIEEQARRFSPKIAALADEKAAEELKVRLADTSVKVLAGESGVEEAAAYDNGTLVSAIVGTAGLVPTMAAVKCGNRRIALANKETLVCSGSLFTQAIKKYNDDLIPVDSEHSAIFQSLMGGRKNEVKRILLTASGGPFFNLPKDEFKSITKERALKHPNWSMGAKITIDSATMMNKGLEVIEAMHLFDVEPERIKVLIHPQSVIHSAVQFNDNAVIAQLGVPDMHVPIQLALTYPKRCHSLSRELDLAEIGSLTFFNPDFEKFDCLKLAMDVAGRKDAAPAVMNAANEAAVSLFLNDKICFNDICSVVSKAVDKLGTVPIGSIDDVLAIDKETKRFVLNM